MLCKSIAASPFPLTSIFPLLKHENERLVIHVYKTVYFELLTFCSFLVIIDVITSREIQCHLHLNPQDPTLNSSDDFITRAVKR